MKLKSMRGLSAFLGFLAAAGSTGALAGDLGSSKDYGYAAVNMPAQWSGFYAGAGLSGAFSAAQVQSGEAAQNSSWRTMAQPVAC